MFGLVSSRTGRIPYFNCISTEVFSLRENPNAKIQLNQILWVYMMYFYQSFFPTGKCKPANPMKCLTRDFNIFHPPGMVYFQRLSINFSIISVIFGAEAAAAF